MITIRTAEPVTVWTGREVFGAQPYVTHTYDVRLEDTAAMWALEPECVGGLTGFNYFNCHCFLLYRQASECSSHSMRLP